MGKHIEKCKNHWEKEEKKVIKTTEGKVERWFIHCDECGLNYIKGERRLG